MSRRRRNLAILLSLPVLTLLVILDNTYIKNRRQSKSLSEKQTQAADRQKYHAGTFTVINVIDGDTLDIDIPDGQFPIRDGLRHEHTRIRLLGIDAPEKNAASGDMHFGQEATEFTRKLVLRKQVEIYLDETNNTRGKYGRLLAYVKLPDERFLNEVLLSEGFAYADLRFHHSLFNKYKQLESRARSGKKGLWQNVTPEQLPKWLQEKGQF